MSCFYGSLCSYYNTRHCSSDYLFCVWHVQLLTYRRWFLRRQNNWESGPHMRKQRIKSKLKSSLWCNLD